MRVTAEREASTSFLDWLLIEEGKETRESPVTSGVRRAEFGDREREEMMPSTVNTSRSAAPSIRGSATDDYAAVTGTCSGSCWSTCRPANRPG